MWIKVKFLKTLLNDILILFSKLSKNSIQVSIFSSQLWFNNIYNPKIINYNCSLNTIFDF